ncbi:MAG: hypothetical protein Q4F31_07910 [Eubacteriales bacterium]|nr:hypothetical protein [Eubacteriales bacterium]
MMIGKRINRTPHTASKGIAVFILCTVFLLSSCGRKEETVYDIGSYGLSKVSLDGTELDLYSVYPSGAGLYLSGSGSSLLILGEESCSAEWTNENGSFSLSFGNLCGTGSFTEETIKVSFEEIGLEYEFTRGENVPVPSAGNEEKTGATDSRISGAWHGRLWFESPEGEWADYEYRSMELSGQAIAGNESGNIEKGTISLYNSYFSETDPIIQISFEGENGNYHSVDGYVMSYPVHEFEMQIDLTNDSRANLRNTLIIEKPGDYGHVYTPEEPADASAENEEIPVLRLSGTCRDSAGSFEYFVELER